MPGQAYTWSPGCHSTRRPRHNIAHGCRGVSLVTAADMEVTGGGDEPADAVPAAHALERVRVEGTPRGARRDTGKSAFEVDAHLARGADG